MYYLETPETVDPDIPDMLLVNLIITEEDHLSQITLIWSGPIFSGEFDIIHCLN